jgi:glutathione peroxidase
LEDTFQAQGFTVLGFYSDDFGMQGGDPGKCHLDFDTSYPQFAIAPVTPPDAQPVFAWIESQPIVGPATSNVPSWNFNKYLVARDGTLVAHWDSTVYPGDDPNDPNDSFDTNPIVIAIRAELAKPPP